MLIPISLHRTPAMADESEKPSLLERLSHFLMREPEDREQLVALLHGAYENSLMDADSLAMIEGRAASQ